MVEPGWINTTATITACRYQPRGLSTLAFGFQTGERFAISFNYYAHGQLYCGEFQSPTAIPQSETIPIAYNPLNPSENTRAPIASGSARPPGLMAIGITGSIILSLLWLAILRGCHSAISAKESQRVPHEHDDVAGVIVDLLSPVLPST